MQRYEEGLVSVVQLLRKKEYPEAWQMKGVLLEKLNKNPEEAKFSYEKALDLMLTRINTIPNNKIAMENMSIAMLYYLLEDTVQAKKMILANKKEARDQGLGDSILNHLSNKKYIIDILLK